jgi:ribosomal protein S19E (S16A)
MDKKQTHFTVKDVPAADFIAAYAEFLKKNKKIVVPKVKIIIKNPLNSSFKNKKLKKFN